jgi:hypothetical protein
MKALMQDYIIGVLILCFFCFTFFTSVKNHYTFGVLLSSVFIVLSGTLTYSLYTHVKDLNFYLKRRASKQPTVIKKPILKVINGGRK